jgi:uncharacterized protein YbaP (TraB family)
MIKMKMPKKPNIALLFLVCCIFCLSDLAAQSLLWKITGNDLKASSYIYGTIHIKDKRAFAFNDSVTAAFENCKAIALEVDLSTENIILLSQNMLLPENQTLKDLFTEDEYQLIKTVVEDASGLDIRLFDRLKPITLLSLVMNNQFANDVEVSVDEYFYRKAKELDKKIIGLETIEEQLNIMDSIPYEYIIDYFRDIDKAKKDIENIISLYQSARLEELLEMMQKDKSMVMIKKHLLTDRNIKMAERIRPVINEQSTFIAVGAGHLPGKKGIINLLAREGYVVKPVK